MTPLALLIIVALTGLLCLAIIGLAVVALAAIHAEPTPAPTAVEDTPTVEVRRPSRRRSRHIHWEHDRAEVRRDVLESLAAGNDRLVRNGLLGELERPDWASNETQPYRHVNREGR